MQLQQKKEFILVISILVLALGLRLWKIDAYMNFLGDEGRDAIIVSDLLTKGNLPFIGPPTSVGNMYLGPLYYYMMALPMAVSGLNPVSAGVMVAFIGVATVGLIYYLSRQWFGFVGAAVASFLYAISPVAITYSRSSWNPNPAPFFTLLAFLGFYRAHKSGNFWWLCLTGFSLAAALQMHYLSLGLLPVFGVLWIYEVSLIKRKKLERLHFWKGTVISAIVFILMMIPLILFDFKHDFMNYKAFMQILGTDGSIKQKGFFDGLLVVYQQKLIGRYLTMGNEIMSWLVSFVVIVPLCMAIYGKLKKVVLRWVFLALGLWLLVSVSVLAVYKGEVYDHYLGFISPAPYILLAAFSEWLIKRRAGVVVLALTVGFLSYLNLSHSPLIYPPNNQLEKTKNIVDFIIAQSEERPFNFALISEHNYDDAYEFFFLRKGALLRPIQAENTGVLYVVCEDVICKPVGNPKFEISAFGWTKQDWQKDVYGVKIYKLSPNPDQPKGAN